MKAHPFSYNRLRARRDKIVSRALRPYISVRIIGHTVYDICNDIMAELPATVPQSAVYDSVRALAGTELTQKIAADFGWRLAGNLEQLTAGIPIVPWTRQLAAEPVPVCVDGVRPFYRKKTPGYLLACRAVAGTPCAMLITQFLSKASCSAISRTLGFSAPWGMYPYSTPQHFVNLLFFANIEADKSYSTPYFSTVTASSSMVKENRTILSVRCRAMPCPKGYKQACADCWVGYDQCQHAVHSHTYVARYCAACNAESFFDPQDPGALCTQCRHVAKQTELAR